MDSPQTYMTGTSARCAPCLLGEYCPQGTYEELEPNRVKAASLARQCDAGYACPTADVAERCPAGTYCVKGSTEQYSCNFADLVIQDALAMLPTKTPSVLERVYLSGDPLGGNYCPQGSETPLTMCALHC